MAARFRGPTNGGMARTAHFWGPTDGESGGDALLRPHDQRKRTAHYFSSKYLSLLDEKYWEVDDKLIK